MNLSTRISFLLITVVFFLAGCETGPIDNLEFKSPDGSITVLASGEVSAPMEPIVVQLAVTLDRDDKVRNLKFEFYNGSMTLENVKAEWMTNSKGQIHFLQRDDTEMRIEIDVTEDAFSVIANPIDKNGHLFLPH